MLHWLGIYLDVSSLKRLHIGNNVLFASESLILLHRRDLKKYCQEYHYIVDVATGLVHFQTSWR